MQTIKYWYVGGDIHGDWRPVRNWVVNELTTPKEESALILLGDVGANYFGDYRDRNLKRALNKIGIRIYCLRGNHEMRVTDAKQYSNYMQIFDLIANGPVYIEDGYPNIRYLRDDGDVYEFGGKRVFAIPGAYSVDKDYRLRMGWDWFPNEQLNISERYALLDQAKNQNFKFDYIIAHTCPFKWEPYISDLFMGGLDQSTIDKATEKFLDIIVKNCSFDHFYFGHFHDDRNIPEVKATMLYKKIIPLGEYIKENANE